MARPKGSKNKPKEVQAVQTTSEAPTTETASTESETPITARPAYLSRSALLKEVSDSNKERYAAENGQEEDQTPEQETEETENQEEQTSETEPEAVEQSQVEATPPQKRKLIIDGVEKELTDDEIIALAQKAGAVDSRLAEAERIRQDAKREAATLRGAQSPAATQSYDQPATRPPAVSSSDADAAEITKTLMYGTEDQVRDAVAKLIGNGRSNQFQGMNPNQIQGLVAETLAFERAKALLDTPPEQGGFNDIYSDQMLRGLFERREAQLRDEGDKRPYQELYKSIGLEVRQWRDDLIKKNTPQTGLENRDQLKRSAGIVRGGGGKVIPPVESKPKTLDETLDGMRRARGLN